LSSTTTTNSRADLDDLYAEAAHTQINTGDTTIHAKRLPGRWRRIKWWAASVWLIFFLGPYLRWDGRQAVLFDIPHRQYHLFGATILPQDFWMLSLLLLFFAVLLAVVTVVAGRVYCGFFCFQTVWTDVFTLIEEWLEGPPRARRALDQAPLSLHKLRLRAIKHGLWLLIGFVTGWSFVAWFYGIFPLWQDFFTGQANTAVYAFVALFTAGTYVLAGWMREQVCFWLCPYARIQGVMLDCATLVPAYDVVRGEPRGRLQRGVEPKTGTQGDCIDCNQCVAVCPTGIDIRAGQQEGCITCALCLDACDQVMDKLARPRGLIRYASLDELEGAQPKPLLLRARVWLYIGILAVAVLGIGYGFSTLSRIELKVLHERSPLFVRLSDGSIQNKYTLKLLNKSTEDLPAQVNVSSSVPIKVKGAESTLRLRHGEVTPMMVFVRIEPEHLDARESLPMHFTAEVQPPDGPPIRAERASAFFAPVP
jgi:cytochrome c oxidase accessory protein FixG